METYSLQPSFILLGDLPFGEEQDFLLQYCHDVQKVHDRSVEKMRTSIGEKEANHLKWLAEEMVKSASAIHQLAQVERNHKG
ncbi:MAG TPA: hypothetical protein VEB60_00985 [Candidatus Paceibacterota bacterium]|nr:hypothetical protein [Candidatus Paceibacterota bacterium]